MLFAIVFGLSMDYEVFLISRMHERWVHTREHSRAVAEGLALTGRVVTAAAAIMVCVFLSFMLGENRVIKEFGLSLASAVLPRRARRALSAAAGGPAPRGRAHLEDPGVARPRAATAEHRGHGAAGGHRARKRRSRRRHGRPGARRRPPSAPGRRDRGSGGLSPPVRRGAALLALLLCATSLAAWPSGAPANRTPRRDSVLLVFLPTDESELARIPGLSVGIMSATQGSYTAEQLLLDITQGARIASSAYSPRHPPLMSLRTVGPRGTAGTIVGWQAALTRAENAPQLLRPGLLTTEIPGAGNGSAYAGPVGSDHLDAIAAADRSGRVAAVSVGTAPTLLARIAALNRTHRLVVADLPSGPSGIADLHALSATRAPGELLLVVQRARAPRGHELLWTAAAGLSLGGSTQRAIPSTTRPMTLTASTTNQRGLIAAVDLAPTILRHLDPSAPVPADMRGEPIRPDGPLHSASLRALMARLHVIGPRRLRALGWLLSAWALLLLASAPWPRARAGAMRTGALAVLWAPVAALIAAALEPSAAAEYLTIVLACLALGALTDLLAPWPRAPLAPALVSVVAIVVDALAHTQLQMRSLLGPNPILGARFYGVGNELKSGLAVLVLAAVAAALYPAVRSRRSALAMAGAGIVLAIVEGSARIGAGVGGVILVCAGAAVATVMLLPGTLTDRRSGSRRALIVLIAPLLGLVALALLDLLTAHGSGHYTGSILHARSPGDLRDVIVRRYTAAFGELHNHAMPVATLLALVCAVLGVRRRERLLAPVAGDPAWAAALCGGLAAGVVGALVEDSGPVLLVVAVFVLVCVLAYLWGGPSRRTLLRPRRGRDSRREPNRFPDRRSDPR